MKEITIKNNTGDSFTVAPTHGAAIMSLVIDGQEVIKNPIAADDLKKGFPSAILFPFPNRVKDGLYHFEGAEYHLQRNEHGKGHALHGLVAFEAFEVVEQKATSVTCSYEYDGSTAGYPFPFLLEIKYTLKKHQLKLEYRATNTGSSAMPAAFGWHPYFQLEDLKVGDFELHLPPHHRIELDEWMIPMEISNEVISEGSVSLRNTLLDHVYKIETDQKEVEIKLKAPKHTLTISQSTGRNKLNYFVLYTPPLRDCIAIEPQTANINAFNNQEGLVVLKPEQSIFGKIEVSISRN